MSYQLHVVNWHRQSKKTKNKTVNLNAALHCDKSRTISVHCCVATFLLWVVLILLSPIGDRLASVLAFINQRVQKKCFCRKTCSDRYRHRHNRQVPMKPTDFRHCLHRHWKVPPINSTKSFWPMHTLSAHRRWPNPTDTAILWIMHRSFLRIVAHQHWTRLKHG